MPPFAFILAQISPPEAAARPQSRPTDGFQRRTLHPWRGGRAFGTTQGASGGDILTKAKAATGALCRPAGWIALWRTIGNLSVLNRNARV